MVSIMAVVDAIIACHPSVEFAIYSVRWEWNELVCNVCSSDFHHAEGSHGWPTAKFRIQCTLLLQETQEIVLWDSF
jgi:hypothetical protein